MYRRFINSWLFILICFMVFLYAGCKSGKKPFKLVNLQAAEEIKLADKVTGVEQMNNKLAEKFKGLENSVMQMTAQLEASVQAIAGVNNKIDKTQQSAGRDANKITNEASLMKYIFGSIIGVAIFGLWILYSLIKMFFENRGLKKSVKEKEIEADELKQAFALATPQEKKDIFDSVINKIEGRKRGNK